MATEKDGMTLREFEAGLFDLQEQTEHVNMMVYGDPGCGKTVFAATVPGNNLWLVGEPGYVAAARQGGKGKARLVNDTASAHAAAVWLEGGKATEYDWVIVDGTSTLNNKFLLAYAAEAFDANPAKRAHRNLPDKPDYFNTQNVTKSWVSRLIDLPVNVLFTAHAYHTEGRDGELRVYPGIQGKDGEVSNYVSGLLHIVGYMGTRLDSNGDPERRILWQEYLDPKTDVRYVAKEQFGGVMGPWSTVRDPDHPKGITMSDVVERCGIGAPAPAAPKKKRATRRAA
jgi:hypothetical protein